MTQSLSINKGKSVIYNIVFEHSFAALAEELANLETGDKKLVIITDSNVGPLYEKELASICSKQSKEVISYTFPAGEENKTLHTVQKMYQFLIENHVNRNDMLIALGGGVVGDITGYLAATYLRGIDFIQVPTTLLSQVDSSIGGKTGVDFEGYKNMVGAFHMPRLVYVNSAVLESLPTRQYFAGFAEIMKAALIKDSAFYEWLITNMYEICEQDKDIVMEMIRRSCEIKKLVVEKDPYEKGERAILNLGHTLGHAIEKYKNFTLLHGECVALGCVVAAHISYQRKLLSLDEYLEIRDMFVPFYLPISIDQIDPVEIVNLTKSDKKMGANGIKFILLKKIGKAVIATAVTDEEMIAAMEEIRISEEDYYE